MAGCGNVSDTEGMVRIIEHAAASLRNARQNNLHTLPADALVAMAYSGAVLRMVAASVAPEGRSLAEVLKVSYPEWADTHDDAVSLSDTELASIARFIVGRAT